MISPKILAAIENLAKEVAFDIIVSLDEPTPTNSQELFDRLDDMELDTEIKDAIDLAFLRAAEKTKYIKYKSTI